MSELATPLRNQLAKVITEARRVAEKGAQQVLQSLAVKRHEPHGSMTLDERSLRNRLRARGRQLGDVRDRQRGNQSINRLTHEVAYEHWHRMLFARFLADNGLLIHPEHQVAMSLEEIEELAQELGEDPHQMAASFAQYSLPQIFRGGDPVLEVRLAPEARQNLETLLDSLPIDVFTADDSLGWTYQYWQAEKKDAVNASGEKIGADELPAVTQLFTEHYMVLFLYHNTIGAWHAGKVLAENPELAETAKNEDELRAAVAINTPAGKSSFSYLRFVREQQQGDEEGKPTGKWRPAADTFEGWPKTAKELKILDPCCGSGHFLVVGFKLMVRLRMHEEGLALEDAIQAVLSDNIHGLELDARCTQIAAFNLAITAWKLAGKPIGLPPLNIACSGLSIASSKKDWLALASDDERLSAGLENLYELFMKAPELGSLIDPKVLKSDLFKADFEELQPLFVSALARESGNADDTERTVAAQGMSRAADLLDDDYTLVITNVPYLGRGQQSNLLKTFAEDHYTAAKADLATIFIDRMLKWHGYKGTMAAVTPQNWLFLTSYKMLRKEMLNNCSWKFVARLGSGAFETIGGQVVNVALLIISNVKPDDNNVITGIDAAVALTPAKKAAILRGEIHVEEAPLTDTTMSIVAQVAQLRNPDIRISLTNLNGGTPLMKHAECYQGIVTGDIERFTKKQWEVSFTKKAWVPFRRSNNTEDLYGDVSDALRWESGVGQLHEYAKEARDQLHDMHESGNLAWGQSGVAINRIGQLKAAPYYGEHFDNNVAIVFPKNNNEISASLLVFALSTSFSSSVRALDQTLKVTNKTLLKIPFDLAKWSTVAEEKFAYGFPQPFSNDPTQYVFHAHPFLSKPASALQVAVGRLLGYKWPAELDTELHLADEAREWVKRCEVLKEFADEDGIVCLSATRGEASAADRLRQLLAAAFGSEWSISKEKELLAVAGDNKKSAASLELWLRDKFFEEHCKLFQNRPFVWHIWDGNPSGFHCLVNEHKLTGDNGEGRRTLDAITYSYLGDWIDRQKDDQQAMTEGADARLASAMDLQQQLENILEGKPPYDLFVRWKPLHEQAIGWEPDINDGVRLNIRPFMNAELRKGGKKGAGILRWKPNIKWKKDRGKDPQSLRPKEDFPWFWSCKGDGSEDDVKDFTAERTTRADFDGNRWNDLHYSRAVKEAARKAHKEKQKEAGH